MVLNMFSFFKSSLLAAASLTLLATEASAQYYNPAPAQQLNGHQPGGLGLDLGLRNNAFNPNVGLGIGQVGAGVGTGVGLNGIGTGANVGVGPLGASVDGGLGRNGLGVRASSGIGNTGAAFNGGVSKGGLGVGANARVLGFGPGASLGVGKNGPGLGASLAFGSLGTLLIGSHRNTYPGAEQTAAHMYPDQKANYYAPQSYGNMSYYKSAPMQQPQYQQHQQRPVNYRHYVTPSCQTEWTC